MSSMTGLSSIPSSLSRRDAQATAAEIDAACRLPLFALVGGAALWLVLGSVLGLIASIKFHSPNFLAGSAWLSYGRVFPASTNALVYGFAVPSGLGVGLWLLARLGRRPLAQPWLVAVGAKLWHIGVLVGWLGILAGDATGFEWLEMPRYAAVILFVAFLFLASQGFAAHHARNQRALYPSQWFVLAALFWFPWIYSTANLLLLVFPVRGVAQAAIQWWFSGNLLFVWFALVGLGASFYFLPKLSGRPLHSHYLALFAFWTLIFFGTWVGIPAGATLPAWMPTLSGVATVATLVPLVTVALIAVRTLHRDEWRVASDAKCLPAARHSSPDTRHGLGGPLGFVKFGVFSFGLSGVLLAASALPGINRVTDFTWFGTAQNQLRLYGFFAMTMFGAAYYILPRAVGMEFPFPKFIRAHFWCGVIGALLLALPLAMGGVVQGLKLGNPDVAFLDVTRSALMFLRLGTVGELLLALGNLLFLVNLLALIARYYRAVGAKAYAIATARLEPAEVQP
jgi:cytochrome c oxidase cbb3-type subunit 1